MSFLKWAHECRGHEVLPLRPRGEPRVGVSSGRSTGFRTKLAALVGYRRYAPNLNNYDCRCPSELLADLGPGVGAVDELVPEHVAGLERFYAQLAA